MADLMLTDQEDDVAALLSGLPLDSLDDLENVPLPSPYEMTALHDLLPLDELSALHLERFHPTETTESADDSQSSYDADNSAGLKQRPKRTRRVRPSAYDSNRARNQRRHELVYLRNRVAEMEAELALVRARAQHEVLTNPHEQETAMTSLVTRKNSNNHIWEHVAMRQLKERRRAETENERLKAALEAQLKVAKSLEAILNKRSTTQSLEACGVSSYTRDARHATNASDSSVFQALLREVQTIYTDAERLVRQTTTLVERPDCSSHDARMRATESGLLVEIFAIDLLPFTLSATSTAAWQYFSHQKNHLPEPPRLYYERLSDDDGAASADDTVMERTALEFVVNGVKAVLQVQQVLRRYEAPDRVAVVWNAIANPKEFDAKPFSGFNLRQWGCMVLTSPTPSTGEETSKPLTVLRSCFFMTPEFQIDNVGEMTGDGDVGKLTEFILTATANSVASWRQRIENILLDSHLHEASSSSIL